MNTLNEVLCTVLEEASFDLENVVTAYDGRSLSRPDRRVSAPELRDICSREERRVLARRVRGNVLEEWLLRLAEELRRVLACFIDPETDRIGHAVPIDANSHTRVTGRPDGFCDFEYHSSLRDFAGAVVQASAITGVDAVCELLEKWEGGEPVRIHMSTVLAGLRLDAPVSAQEDVEVVPLGLSTDELPRLPFGLQNPPRDFLGLSLMTMKLSVAPALFRPEGDEGVRLLSAGGMNLDLWCEALSLQADRHVDLSLVWNDYPDAAAFSLAKPSPWRGSRLKPVRWKSLTIDEQRGGATMVPFDDLQCLDGEELGRTAAALGRADRKLRIATDRWRRSKRPDARLEDRYIDLRIALESLYLKDFVTEHSSEMRFRLSLFGAWHLAEDLEERRRIRKVLRDAYDTASAAVHLGEVPRGRAGTLSAAQELCRQGILRLLFDGPPRDWGDLILGAGGEIP